jgi:hypothetical protein
MTGNSAVDPRCGDVQQKRTDNFARVNAHAAM